MHVQYYFISLKIWFQKYTEQKSTQGKQWFLYTARLCALDARAPGAALQWHTLVAVTLAASGHLPEPDSMPRLVLQRWHYKEDRNNLLRSRTPEITYQPRWSSVTETLPSHTGIWGTW